MEERCIVLAMSAWKVQIAFCAECAEYASQGPLPFFTEDIWPSEMPCAVFGMIVTVQ